MSLSIKNRYSPRLRVLNSNTEPSMVRPEYQKESDVNNILRKYRETGQLPNTARQNPTYGDFSNAISYSEALNKVISAQNDFNQLSSQIRDRFANDPAKLLAFISDPKNVEEGIKLGLIRVSKKIQGAAPAAPGAPAGSKPAAAASAASATKTE